MNNNNNNEFLARIRTSTTECCYQCLSWIKKDTGKEESKNIYYNYTSKNIVTLNPSSSIYATNPKRWKVYLHACMVSQKNFVLQNLFLVSNFNYSKT